MPNIYYNDEKRVVDHHFRHCFATHSIHLLPKIVSKDVDDAPQHPRQPFHLQSMHSIHPMKNKKQNSIYFCENGAKHISTPMIENNRSHLATIASASRHAIQTHVATTTHSTIAQTSRIHTHRSHSVHFSTHYTDYIEKI